MSNTVEIEGSGEVVWAYPRIGTCGEPSDQIRLSIMRVRAIPDLLISFDGERNGWVISGQFFSDDLTTDDGVRELAFVPEYDESEPPQKK